MTTPLDRASAIEDNPEHPAWDEITERIADELTIPQLDDHVQVRAGGEWVWGRIVGIDNRTYICEAVSIALLHGPHTGERVCKLWRDGIREHYRGLTDAKVVSMAKRERDAWMEFERHHTPAS